MQLLTPFIILGDFNAHNPQNIDDIITGTFPVIDLICSPILFPYFIFLVCNNLCSSNHFPLFLSFHNFNHNNNKNPRYIFDRANWTIFILNAFITPPMTKGDINRAVRWLLKVLLKRQTSQFYKPLDYHGKYCRPWLNDECQQEKKREQKALGNFSWISLYLKLHNL